MPDYTVDDLLKRMDGLQEGKGRSVLVAMIKRKEGKTIDQISKDLLKSWGAIRGWLVQGLERGLDDLADYKPPGRAHILYGRVVETVREVSSESPEDLGYARRRWQINMLQKETRNKLGLNVDADVVRRALHAVRFSYRKSRTGPQKAAPDAEFKQTAADTLRHIMWRWALS